MAKANTSCSIDALDLDDARAYKTKKTKGQQVAFVNKALKEATKEHADLIAEVQSIHPGLINSAGEFLEDLEAARLDAEFELEQRSLFDREGTDEIKTIAARQSKAAKKIDKGAKDANTQPKAKSVAPKKQAAPTPATGSGNARLKKTAGKSKAPGKKGAALKWKAKTKAKSDEDEKQGVTSVAVKPEQAVRKEQQPADLIVPDTKDAEDIANLPPQERLDHNLAEFTTATTVHDKVDAAMDIFLMNAFAPSGKNTQGNANAHALELALGLDKDNVLWGGCPLTRRQHRSFH